MDAIFWAAVVFALLGMPRLVWAFVAANRRVSADVAFYNAIPAGMEWSADIEEKL